MTHFRLSEAGERHACRTEASFVPQFPPLIGLYLSLNCLIMLEIFSKRCTSEWAACVAWAMTRKVALSKRTILCATENPI